MIPDARPHTYRPEHDRGRPVNAILIPSVIMT
jgi:hypothetical protein